MIKSFTFFCNTPAFLSGALALAIVIKCSIIARLHFLYRKRIISSPPLLLLMGLLGSSLFSDFAWVVKLIRQLVLPGLPYIVLIFFVRIAWASFVVQYQCLALLITSLVDRACRFSSFQRAFIILSAALTFYFIGIAFFDTQLTTEQERSLAFADISWGKSCLEVQVMRYTVVCFLNFLLIPSIVLAFTAMRKAGLPRLLKLQIRTLILFLFLPFLLFEFMLALHFHFAQLNMHIYCLVGISTLMITGAVLFCIRRVLNLRFLNNSRFIIAQTPPAFINQFRTVLERLSQAQSAHELETISQAFCKQALTISSKCISLWVSQSEDQNTGDNPIASTLHHAISDRSLYEFIYQEQVLIRDELEFSAFYRTDRVLSKAIDVLKHLNADIVVPLFEKELLLGALVIKHDSTKHVYTIAQRNSLLVFCRYVATSLYVTYHRSSQALLAQEKELKHALYQKHQEINHCKESIKSFIASHEQKETGIILFKDSSFVCANQAASRFLPIDPSLQPNHPLAKSLRILVQHVQEFKTPQTLYLTDAQGKRIQLTGTQHLEHEHCIITINYPALPDLLEKQLNLLKDPTKWDYVLYLETTHAGRLINQLLPATSESLLSIKINLLNATFNRDTVLLCMAEDDAQATISLIHELSMRQELKSIRLQGPSADGQLATMLFGVYRPEQRSPYQPGLLAATVPTTVALYHIEYLDNNSQERLLEYISFGYYRPYQSDQRMQANARMVCTTVQHMPSLVHEGIMSAALWHELRTATITFPSPAQLTDQEMSDLIDGFGLQTVHAHGLYDGDLTESDKQSILVARPASISSLKAKVVQLITKKLKKGTVISASESKPTADENQEVFQAAYLGKRALKDPDIMRMLWQKFKNQNQIATLLGVNRSSVNRRCREYELF